jgi:uncharacterized membrane protein YjjP (DUF1212 family)/uncharacterized membrane protein YjjB (DUF3815 family)
MESTDKSTNATGASPTDDSLVAEVRDLLVELGVAMSVAGDSVDAIDSTLREIVAAYGVEHVEVAVLPTSLMVSTGQGTGTQIQIGVPQGPSLRFDQVAELYSVVRAASSAAISPSEALDRLDAVSRMPPTFRWPLRTFGHAVLTVGLALLLQPTMGAVLAAFVLGLFVGLLKLPRLATSLELVFPVVVSFVVAVIVFATLQQVEIDNPVRILIPPLVTFLPGAALTIGTVELAAGQMVSGASRLVSGLVKLMLLAFALVAASVLFELPARVLADHPVNRLGWWAPWVGVVVFALGIYLHLSSPARSLPWILVIMLAAYAGQAAGAAVFGGMLSGFFGAVAMTPLALWAQTTKTGPPKLVTFLPGFWLLVPGAAGLLGVTELLGVDHELGAQAVVDMLVTVMSIALGVLIGTAAYRATDSGVRAFARTV